MNTSFEPIIQDKSKLKVVVALLDATTGEVLNANKVKVGETTGISIREADKEQVGTAAYYDLQGRRVLRPSNGLYIQSKQLKNGETVSRKVLVK